MRQVVAMFLMVALAACGEDVRESGESEEAMWVKCNPDGPAVTIQIYNHEQIADFAAMGCQDLRPGGMLITGGRISSLEGLDQVRAAYGISLNGTFVDSLAPLDGMRLLTGIANFEQNPSLTYCEIKRWSDLVRSRDPRNTFKVEVDLKPLEEHPDAGKSCD